MVLEACRASEVARVVVAASDKAYGAHDELPYREDFGAAAALPLRRLEGRDRPHRPLVLAHLRAARGDTRFANIYGGGDTNRSRLVPEAVAAVLAGRAAGHPLRRHARARLPLRRRRGGGLPGDRRRARRRRRRGEAFNAGWGSPHAVREVVELICELGPGRGRARHPGQGTRAARSTASTSTRASCASSRAGSRGSGWRRGCAGPSTGTGPTPRSDPSPQPDQG